MNLKADPPKFELDEQTLTDLSIYPTYLNKLSVFTLFDHTVTYGGAAKLREMFRNPLTDLEQLKHRVDILQHLQKATILFPIDKGSCDFVEHYLKQSNSPVGVSKIKAVYKRAKYWVKGSNEYYIISRGIYYTIELLAILTHFLTADLSHQPVLLRLFREQFEEITRTQNFTYLKALYGKKQFTAIEVLKSDFILRYVELDNVKLILDLVYQLDVFLTVSSVANKLHFVLPTIESKQDPYLTIEGLFHPLIEDPVSNKVNFSNDQNIYFVTGANMAGKSTLLKSVAICVFLSQLGFPVPAAYMATGGFKGLITSINLSDDPLTGSSHFYAEVSRVKHVAKKINDQENILVIFDELFRGTNVKDAYDASLAVINAFTKLSKTFFIVSTHIVEVAHQLVENRNINFRYMETSFINGTPSFSYQLQEGITEERLGMWIVEYEGILTLIADAARKQNQQKS